MADQFKYLDCKHGAFVFSFFVELSDCVGGGGATIYLCQQCYDALKGTVLQDVINDAVKSSMEQFAQNVTGHISQE